MIVIAPAHLRDVSFVTANLRDEDRQEIFCQWIDEDTETFSRAVVDCTPHHRYVALENGNPTAVFGVTYQHPGLWGAWAYGTKRLRRAVPAITRYLCNVLAPKLLNAGANRVEVRTLVDHDIAHRWLERLGAVREGLLPEYGKNGETFVLYVWRRGDLHLPLNAYSKRNESPMCLSTPKAPAPPPPPPATAEEDPEIRSRQEAERRRLRKAKGRASTILTSGLGVSSSDPSSRKTLLGD